MLSSWNKVIIIFIIIVEKDVNPQNVDTQRDR